MKQILALLLFFTTTLLSAQIDSVKDLLNMATEKEKANDYDGALPFYEMALRLAPKNAEIYCDRATAYQTRKMYREAKNDFDRAILLDSKNPKYYNRRAILFNMLNYSEYAIRDTDKALEYAGDNLDEKSFAYYERAEAKMHNGRLESALEDYNSALANSPIKATEMGALLSSASVLGDLGRNKEAITRLETLVKKHPDFTAGYNNLGFQYIQDAQYKKAVQTFDALIKVINARGKETYEIEGAIIEAGGAENAAPLNNRGFAKFKLGDKKGALKDINESLKIDPANPYAFKNRALVYLANKKNKDACADLQKALDLGYTKAYGNEVQELIEEHCKE
ncbi:MAG: tetratricopeptide repeat protein [Bacteroidota bacterium]